jgi:hypothetical protein
MTETFAKPTDTKTETKPQTAPPVDPSVLRAQIMQGRQKLQSLQYQLQCLNAMWG